MGRGGRGVEGKGGGGVGCGAQPTDRSIRVFASRLFSARTSPTSCSSHMRPAPARGAAAAVIVLPVSLPHIPPHPSPSTAFRMRPAPARDMRQVPAGGAVTTCAKYLRETCAKYLRETCAKNLRETCAKYLREVRRLRLRRPFQVAEYGMALINSADERSKLGDEVWDVMEQVAIAAMDCQQLGIAKECIGALMIAFPNSTRVGRLEGMWLEAKGWWDQADKVYSDLLESNPQDQQVLKRQVAVLKGKGNTVGAISALKKYLETYMADYEAWKELGDLYISLHMFKQAAFCYEELLLSAPVNPIYHVTYAEILYSIGGAENYRQAISHYAAATEYSGGTNLRALYGTCMASAALRSAGKPSRGAAAVEGEPEGLVEATAEAIKQEYRFKRPELLKPVVEPTLAKLVL
ncbi:unnamed protein product [Closterium sp. NIES-65]|nr:unnamed protein product [Closterium sp. NIES-65]